MALQVQTDAHRLSVYEGPRAPVAPRPNELGLVGAHDPPEESGLDWFAYGPSARRVK
jgi:hypothetical protein